MTKGRNTKGEYRRRRELGEARGLTVAQSRGHAREDEASVSRLKESGVIPSEQPHTLERFYRSVRGIASGKSLSQSAKDEGLSPSTVRRLDRDRGLLYKEYRTGADQKQTVFHRWGIQRSARFPVLEADGTFHEHVNLDAKNASIVGQYWNAARTAMQEQWDPSALRSLERFSRTTAYDVDGRTYSLETDLNRLYEFFHGWSREEREEFDRNFGSEKVVVRRGP